MKRLAILLAAAMWTQTAAAVPDKAEPSRKMPADPGMRTVPPASGKTPSDPVAVVVPPRTGTEEIVKTPRKDVDPKIDDATEDIDRKNRKRSEQKSAR